MNTTIKFDQSLFVLSDPKLSYLSPANKEVLQQLTESVNKKEQLLLLAGESKCGKETLVKRMVSELQGNALLVNISQECLNYEALVDLVGNSLTNNFPTSSPLEDKLTKLTALLRTERLNHVVFFMRYSLSFQATVIEDTLKLIESTLFSECEAHLVVTGSPDLKKSLQESNLPVPVIERAKLLHLNALQDNEIAEYIDFQLKPIEKLSNHYFTEAAMARIIRYAKGLPGLINRLCSLGLLTANVEEQSIVTGGMVDEVLENSLFLGNEFGYTPNNEYSSKAPIQEYTQPTIVSQVAQRAEAAQIKAAPRNNPKRTEPLSIVDEGVRAEVDAARNNTGLTKSAASINYAGASARSPMQKKKTVDANRSKVAPAFFMGVVFMGAISAAGWYFLKSNGAGVAGLVNSPDTIAATRPPKIKQPAIQQVTIPKLQVIAAVDQKEVPTKPSAIVIAPLTPTVSTLPSASAVIKTPPVQKQVTTVVQKPAVAVAMTTPITNNSTVAANPVVNVVPTVKPVAVVNPVVKPVTTTQAELKQAEALKAKTTEKINRAKVDGLLSIAKSQFTSQRLMLPVEDCAWTTYKKVLKLDPENEKALAGLYKIQATYTKWAQKEITAGNKVRATDYLNKALEIAPNDPTALDMLLVLKGTKVARKTTSKQYTKEALERLLESNKGVTELLAIADEKIKDKNLTSPPHNNALGIYQLILSRFSGHRQATVGIDRIKNKYLAWGKYEIKQGNFPYAEYFYKKALEIAPSDPEVLSNLEQLKKTTGSF